MESLSERGQVLIEILCVVTVLTSVIFFLPRVHREFSQVLNELEWRTK